jgi:hypothetical protein
MRTPVRSRSRAIKILIGFVGVVVTLALLTAAGIWWLDAAYLSVVFVLILVFSVRPYSQKGGQ